MRAFLLSTLFHLLCIQGYSQNVTLKGYIQNIHEEPIVYVNIGIENKGVDCMSDPKVTSVYLFLIHS